MSPKKNVFFHNLQNIINRYDEAIKNGSSTKNTLYFTTPLELNTFSAELCATLDIEGCESFSHISTF